MSENSGPKEVQQLDYLDFNIQIGQRSNNSYLVVARMESSDIQYEAQRNMRSPFTKAKLEYHLTGLENALLRSSVKRRRIDTSGLLSVQQFGSALFGALFTEEIADCLRLSQREASRLGKGLRLRFRVHAPELAALPWEYIYDKSRDNFLALSVHTPIVRHVEVSDPISPLAVEPPLRILGMIASPKAEGVAELDTEQERHNVEKALQILCEQGIVELTWLQGQTPDDLQRALRQSSGRGYHIFHFIGHGGFDIDSDEGMLAFANEQGGLQLIKATQLGNLLRDHQSLRFVMLNACEGARGSERDIFSNTATILVRKGIPAVLAMQYAISDDASIVFAKSFYEALVDGSPIDTSVSEARKSIDTKINNTLEWGTPVLYMRATNSGLLKLGHLRTLPKVADVESSPLPFSPDEVLSEAETRLDTEAELIATIISEPEPELESEVEMEPQEPLTVASRQGRYESLSQWLRGQDDALARVRLTFRELEGILGAPLPPYALKNRSWWANVRLGSRHSSAWLGSGWRVASINIAANEVMFQRMLPSVSDGPGQEIAKVAQVAEIKNDKQQDLKAEEEQHLKYDGLKLWLASQNTDKSRIRVTFQYIERLIGALLPAYAHARGKSWWANVQEGRSQSSAWLGAGWRVSSVDWKGKEVTFERINSTLPVD